MSEKKKATDKAANGILNMAQQIIRNYQEDYGFADVIDWLKDNSSRCVGFIPAGSTPNVLALGGAQLDYDLVITPGTIVKCMSSPEERRHGHDLDRNTFKQLIHELRNPIVLLKGSKPDTLVAVTDLTDREGRPIIVSIALNRRNAWHLVNQITSAYGRNNFDAYLRRQIEDGNLIAINKNKANQLSRSYGVQFPEEEALISFDNSISYSLKKVKGFLKNNTQELENISVEEAAQNMQNEYMEELADVLQRLNSIVEYSEEVVEMIKFFEYAGPDIRNSILWHQFQQDKDFLGESELVSRLQDVISMATGLSEKIEKENVLNDKEKTNKQDLLLS